MKNKALFFFLLFLIIVAAGIILLIFNLSGNKNAAGNINNVNNEATGQINDETAVLSENVALPPYNGEPIYILGNDLAVINALPKEVVEKQKSYLQELEISLNENPNNFDGWIAAGLHKKFFNNYSGARDAWEYAKLVSPDSSLSYLNLANLYGYYLNNLKKAEENYLLAIDRDPVNSYGSYYALANFYRDFGFKEKAINYYKQVLDFSPNDESVKVEIGRLSH